jgi:AcrR family transcriptional regulator
VENVALQKVASRAGVAYSTVHYYFGNTDQGLIDKALGYVAKASEEFMNKKMAPAIAAIDKNALNIYIEAKFEWNNKFPTYASMLCYFLYQTTRDKAARKLSLMLHQETLKKIQTLVLQEIGKGHILPVMNIEVACTKIQTVLSGALLTDATADGIKDGSIKKLAVEMIDDVLPSHAKAK